MKPTTKLTVLGLTLVMSLGVVPAVSVNETAMAKGGFKGGMKGSFNKASGAYKPSFSKPVAKQGKSKGLAGVKPTKPIFNAKSGAVAGKAAGKTGGGKSGGKKGLAGVKPVKPIFNKKSGAAAVGGGKGGKGGRGAIFQKPKGPNASPKRLKPIFNPAANPPKKPGKGDPPPKPNGPKFPGPKWKPPGF